MQEDKQNIQHEGRFRQPHSQWSQNYNKAPTRWLNWMNFHPTQRNYNLEDHDTATSDPNIPVAKHTNIFAL